MWIPREICAAGVKGASVERPRAGTAESPGKEIVHLGRGAGHGGMAARHRGAMHGYRVISHAHPGVIGAVFGVILRHLATVPRCAGMIARCAGVTSGTRWGDGTASRGDTRIPCELSCAAGRHSGGFRGHFAAPCDASTVRWSHCAIPRDDCAVPWEGSLARKTAPFRAKVASRGTLESFCDALASFQRIAQSLQRAAQGLQRTAESSQRAVGRVLRPLLPLPVHIWTLQRALEGNWAPKPCIPRPSGAHPFQGRDPVAASVAGDKSALSGDVSLTTSTGYAPGSSRKVAMSSAKSARS